MNEELRSELLSAYHDGELPSLDRVEVERLLAEDESAQRELEELQELSATISAAGTEPAPDGLRAAVLRRVERESLLSTTESRAPGGEPPADRAQFRRSRSWVAVAAGLATVAAGLLISIQLAEEPDVDSSLVAESDSPSDAARPNDNSALIDDLATDGESLAATEAAKGRVDEADLAKDFDDSRDEDRVALRMEKSAGGRDLGRPPGSTAGEPAVAAIHRATNAIEESEAPDEGAPEAEPRDVASALEFGGDLERARVGDVVRAIERSGGEVAVVRLTVVDRREGLEALQLLLARNDVVPTDREADKRKRLLQGAGTVDGLEAVYVEASPEQLAKTLEQMHDVATFRSLDVDEPLALADLSRVREGKSFEIADASPKAGAFAPEPSFDRPGRGGGLTKPDARPSQANAFRTPPGEPQPSDPQPAPVADAAEDPTKPEKSAANRDQVAERHEVELEALKKQRAFADAKPQDRADAEPAEESERKNGERTASRQMTLVLPRNVLSRRADESKSAAPDGAKVKREESRFADGFGASRASVPAEKLAMPARGVPVVFVLVVEPDASTRKPALEADQKPTRPATPSDGA